MTHDAYSTKRVTVWKEDRDSETGYAIKYWDGYISWCPKAIYERDYQPVTAMSFGHALHAIRNGKRVARAGWNGKGMWLRYFDPYFDKEFSVRENGNVLDSDSGTLLSWIGMHTADNKFVPWLASQTDMLADDWTIVE